MVDVPLMPVHREIETPLDRQVYGAALKVSGLLGRVGNRPVGFRLRDVFSTLGLETPKSLDLYRRFDLWLIPNRVSVMRGRGMAEVTALGFECEFDAEGRTLCVVELLPTPAFVRYGGLDGKLDCGGVVSAAGTFGPLGTPAPAGIEPDRSQFLERGGLRFWVDAQVQVGLAFSCAVATPYVHAVGIGSDRVEWRFDVHRDPLFGRDIQMWVVLALPKGQGSLRYRARLSVTARTAFFPTRQQSDWQELRCILTDA